MLEAPTKGTEISRNSYNPSFVKLGVFRKGSPKIDGKMGKDLGDRFRFEPEIGDSYKKILLKDLIADVLGSTEPTTIRAELMGATVDDVLFSYYTRHNAAKKLLVQCTGRTVLKEFCDRTKRLLTVNKPCANQDDRLMHCQECQPDSKLHIYIPELAQKTVDLGDSTGYRFFGGLDIISASISDGFHLAGRLQGLEVMANSLGMTLNGMPVIITRKTEERSGVDRKPTKKENGKTVPNPNFMKSFKKTHGFIEVELDTLRWAEKLHKRGITGDNPFLLSEGEQNLLPQPRVALPSKKAASPNDAIASTQDQDIIKKAFTAELNSRGLDTESKTNRSIIGETLIDLGYTKIGFDGETIFGDANKIPIDLIKQVANKVEDALNGANLTATIDVEAIATQPQKPLRTANPDDIQSYLDSTVPVR
jgi:hypothetical protein